MFLVYVGGDSKVRQILGVNGFGPICISNLVRATEYVKQHEDQIDVMVCEETIHDQGDGMAFAKAMKPKVVVLVTNLDPEELPVCLKSVALANPAQLVAQIRATAGQVAA